MDQGGNKGDLNDSPVTQKDSMEEHAAANWIHIDLVIQPMRSQLGKWPGFYRLVSANSIPEDVEQRKNLITLLDRQDGETKPEREWLDIRQSEEPFDRQFAGQKLGVVQREPSKFFHLGWHLIAQAFQVTSILPDGCLPVLIGAICHDIVRRIEFDEQLRCKEFHDRFRPLFGLGFHRMCALPEALDLVGSGAVRSNRCSRVAGTA